MGTTQADRRRTESIKQYDVLGRPPRYELLATVELAAKVCDTPMATINLITDDYQHQVAAYGFDASVCDRKDSMCAVILDDNTPVVVKDARTDRRFMHNPFVTGELGHVRFYASHKLTTPGGVDIGTICVFDVEPRTLSITQVGALSTLAARVVDVLELALRTRELAKSNERLSAFAGRVSHDLRTPLTSICLSLETLRDQIEEGTPATELTWLLDSALAGSERMAALIREVLSYARLGGGLASGPVDLDRVLDEVVADLAGSLEGAAVERGPLPTLVGDAVQLRSVLQNLLDNAARYRHPERPLVVTVTAEPADGRWLVAVADNGLGVPEADRRRVFEPRVRLTDDGEGSGIGLDTCRRVVQAHGGTIDLEETPGGGTTVLIDLPG